MVPSSGAGQPCHHALAPAGTEPEPKFDLGSSGYENMCGRAVSSSDDCPKHKGRPPGLGRGLAPGRGRDKGRDRDRCRGPGQDRNRNLGRDPSEQSVTNEDFVMRRPNDTNKSASAATAASQANREEGRLSRMKRMLADSLLLGRRQNASPVPFGTKLFGVRLQDVALSPEGVPVIVVRICTFLENHGLQREDLFNGSSTNSKLAERLRSSLEKRWDAMDLESSGDVCTTALLLVTWLKELPEPILCNFVATEVLSTHEKMRDEDPATWRESVTAVLCTLPAVNIRLLQYLLRFLHRYCVYQQQMTVTTSASPRPATLNHLGGVFAPLIVLKGLEQSNAQRTAQANQFTVRLILDQTALFHQWLIDNSLSSGRQRASISKKRSTPLPLYMVPSTTEPSNQHRKRKERNESSGSNQSLERKVIRSSSEERRIERVKSNVKNDNIRRVNSHEDFLSTKRENPNTQPVLPLHESNHVEIRRKVSVQSKDEPQRDCRLDGDSQPLIDESEHEQRRCTERFSRALIPPRSLGRRNVNRRKKLGETYSRNSEGDGNTSSKENDDGSEEATQRPIKPQTSPVLVGDSSEPPVSCRSQVDEAPTETTHTFLQLHTTERERSPSPSVSPCTPPLDLSTLHQNVDGSEPITSRVSWGFAQSQQQDENERDPMLSPRNSMILPHRTFMDHNVPPSPPREHAPTLPGASRELENYAGRLRKQIISLKKRLKRYEETFERDCGYRPSLTDKMTNKDTKRLCIELSKLRKEMKQIKDDPLLIESSNSFDRPSTSSSLLQATMEETFNDVERVLNEKRRSAGRPEALEDMTVVEQAAEKIAIQKCLLHLEQMHGRAQSKEDREMVRPLYDRYRAFKRIVARSSSSKLKDAVNELETIHEHEAMDFTPLNVNPGTDSRKNESNKVDSSLESDSNSSSNVSSLEKAVESKPSTSTGSLSAQSSLEDASDSQTSSSDSMGENLHALPLSELILQLIQTREEKLKLKQQRRALEEQIAQRTGRRPSKEERATPNSEYASVYTSYKQTKAKLRLLGALVAKHRKQQRVD